MEWDEDRVEELRPLHNDSVFRRADKLCPEHAGQLRADVLRYEILERFGGVWVDADFECLRDPSPLLEDVRCFAAWEVQDRWANNAIMGAVSTHPFLEQLIRGLTPSVNRNRGARPNKVSGPQYLTRQLKRHGRGVTVFDQELFYPYGYKEVHDHGPGDTFQGAYAAHHWANQRRERGAAVPA